MATLLCLPQELLLRILALVKSIFFRENLRRLTIAKRWFPVAMEVLFTDVVITFPALRQLMTATDA